MNLGDRMKLREHKTRIKVNADEPVIVRLDGKAFHTWTKKIQCKKPFDISITKAMQFAAINTCREVGQVIVAYSQSDEITFLLNGWQKIESDVWFNGNVQKIASVFSSIFTVHFNMYMLKIFVADDLKLENVIPAFFDARVFNIEREEIEDVFVWRQRDARRNSIQGVAQSLYSHKELQRKNTDDMKKMILQKNVNWDELSNLQKWGFVVKKEVEEVEFMGDFVYRNKWIFDIEIPYFTEDRDYLKNIIK